MSVLACSYSWTPGEVGLIVGLVEMRAMVCIAMYHGTRLVSLFL